jgi:hypothetical protein
MAESEWLKLLDCQKKAAEARAKGLKPEDCNEKAKAAK